MSTNNITQAQQRNLITALGRPMAMMIIKQLHAGNARRPGGPAVNNTQPIYAANNDYDGLIDGMLIRHLTVTVVQGFFETVLALQPKHIHALRDEGITHPHDLENFTSTEFNHVIRSLKSKAALPGLAVVRLKQTCNFFQYLFDTNRKIKDSYWTHNSIKSHAVQF